MMKYYVYPKNQLGNRAVISSATGRPTDADLPSVVEVVLPDGDYLRIKGKLYPAAKVARAIVAGQLDIADVSEEVER